MNFFDYQDRARKWTRWLVGLYALAVALIVAAVYLAVDIGLSKARGHVATEAGEAPELWDSTLFCWTAGVTVLIILSGTLYKIAQLAAGGSVVAEMLGGTLLSTQPGNPDEQRLRNVVEEMAIAAGVPVPRIYILKRESGINAFAAGNHPDDAAIAVTAGALHELSRDELQGVIAHEFSHILNGDMRMNLRLMGLLNGILMIALTGYYLMRATSGGGGRRGKGSNPLPLIGLAVMATGYIGVFVANLIKAAIGREREYLADAAAAQFTRNPAGLAGALKKIGALAAGSTVTSPQAAQASYFFIAEPGASSWLNFLETHPPLVARIGRLDPSFNGDFSAVARAWQTSRAAAPARNSPQADMRNAPPPSAADVRANVSGLSSRVGAPVAADVAYAAALIDALPPACRRAAATPDGAQAVLFGLLLSADAGVRQAQLTALAGAAPGSVYVAVPAMVQTCADMPPACRLPLADLAVGSLRQLMPGQYNAFRQCMLALVMADRQIDVFEFALLHSIGRRLDRQFGLAPSPRVRWSSVAEVRDEMTRTLGALAWSGTDARPAAEAAFNRAWEALEVDGPATLPERGACQPASLEPALIRLAEAAPQLKSRLLAACAACVAADGRTTVKEAETLRAVADALDCPVPPFAPDAA